MPKHAGGRPKKQFDLKDLEKLALMQCTLPEVAAFFGCKRETIENRMKSDEEFSDIYKKGQETGKMSLRRKMYTMALDGNVTMAIWLSKQYLGFADKSEVKTDMDLNLNKLSDTELDNRIEQLGSKVNGKT